MFTLKITKIGDSEGVILPREVLARLQVGEGDHVHLTETPDGYTIRAYDPDFERQMKSAERIMQENHDILKKLAE